MAPCERRYWFPVLISGLVLCAIVARVTGLALPRLRRAALFQALTFPVPLGTYIFAYQLRRIHQQGNGLGMKSATHRTMMRASLLVLNVEEGNTDRNLSGVPHGFFATLDYARLTHSHGFVKFAACFAIRLSRSAGIRSYSLTGVSMPALFRSGRH